MRRVNPRLMAAFEREQQPPIEPNPDLMAAFDAAGVAPEAPPVNEGVKPRSRFDVVREYLEANRQPMPQPTTPEVDVRAAADSDARRNFGASMLAAGQAFTGNRRAVGQMQSSNVQESQALAEREARKRELEQWAAGRERQRMGEAGLLGQALSADEMAAQREASLGVQKERLKLDETKATTADENADADREARAQAVADKLAAKKGTGKPGAAKVFKDVSALRKEFNALPEVKSFKEASTSFDKIQRAAAAPSAAGDLSLIFAYMKVLDPGSTVREGEFAAAAAAAGADQRLLGALEKVRSGQKLTPEQRADFVARAKDLYAAQRAQYDTQSTLYRRLAEKQGADPDDIVGVAAETKSQAAPEKPPEGKVAVEDPANPGVTLMLSPAAAARLKGKKP